MKVVEILLCQRLEAFDHFLFPYRLQRMVTANTTVEGLDQPGQLEAGKDFCELLERVQ